MTALSPFGAAAALVDSPERSVPGWEREISGLVAEALVARIAARTARVGVVGLGYAGLPLALRFAECGFPVSGFDIDAGKVAAIAAGRSPVHGIEDARVAAAGIAASTGLEGARACDALILCVPTPIGRHKEPDLGPVAAALAALRPHLRPGQVLALESTTYPGTTEDYVLPALRAAGLTPGIDAFALYSPEREDPGNPEGTVGRVPKLLAGATPACLAVGRALYGPVAAGRLVPLSSLRAAELAKLYENVFRAVNIGLVNELKRISHALGLDVHEVIDAAATKPFGFMPFRPGPGLGGHCIPVDPYYLAWKARELGVPSDFVELAGRVNDAMPGYVVSRLRDALDARGRALRGARLLLVGLAYKPGVPDTRESPAAEILRLLDGRGASLAYHDPLVPRFTLERGARGGPLRLESQALAPDFVAAQDAVLIVTPQPGIDFAALRAAARLVVDTRGVYRDAAVQPDGALPPGTLPFETRGDFPPQAEPAYHRVIQA
ncbi:nucleotide sugar dehydrogenase [Teichococcus aestuarii]|uniref:UDP-N-acetyl-D-glucosamine dehydrogenase n=1 Tax=Teichococcus aestuarii TaxID=568898 RepID=A0A2U1V845_9PROT|nr:nucleotide sugar dehydrogenase [Pseudoroseomonas aestuarii]PWC30087.1 UDP-N-acetyl-D-glucosamine dehydrogenase [Pseudoroseomonas aestuarii]